MPVMNTEDAGFYMGTGLVSIETIDARNIICIAHV